MDHFNATVKDGKLVNTRRGLQVSRQKFNGISFVNTSAQDSPFSGEQSFRLSTESSSKTATPLPAIRFADDGNNLQISGNSANTELGQALTPNLSFVAETGQPQESKKQPRRRAAPKGQTPHRRRSSTSPYLSSPDSRPSSRSSAATPSPLAEEATFRFLASSFTVSQQQQPQLRQTFTTPSVHHRQYHYAQHLQASNLPSAMSPPLSPPWPTTEAPPSISFHLSTFAPSQADWELFHHYNTHYLPLQLYPYENILTYNPAHSNGEECSIASSDIAAFHCVLMCGTIAEAVLHGRHHLSPEPETSARGFAYHISKICAILNRKLDGSEEGGGCYVGRLDHWHMHMRGLQKVLDVLGGLGQGASLPAWVVRRIHNADLKGAMALASIPYLPLTRSLSPSLTAAAVLTPAYLAQTTHTLNSILQPLRIHPSTITTLNALANFSSAIHLARQSPDNSVKFDPYVFTEELQSITYDLLTIPAPLDQDTRADRHLQLNTEGNLAENLSPALRIASLLFLKDLLPEYPRNLGGYSTLLKLLRQYLQSTTHIYSEAPTDNAGEELVAPRLGQHPLTPALRKVLIFLCLIGDISTHAADKNSCRHDDPDTRPSEQGDEHEQSKEVFRECLLSIHDSQHNIGGEDLEFARLFNLGESVDEEGWYLQGVLTIFSGLLTIL
ncbi:hypothetical protein QBC40DRAFT_341447 [Triangularia verruculosa]|uniref:Uncharacterized protein n=1 Tax=Triangularia verruculosa TaxID=2587418 RepID=A0AAN6XD94_9PEZI|nr:hypothetical protein QBC40DRAFT_341447 [Triangularia verruculosa]